jgi:hypothetical protein
MKFIHKNFKFKGMRKENSFTFYPVLPGENVFLIQSDRRIGRVNLDNGTIYLSKGRTNGSYGPDLCDSRGAKTIELNEEQIKELTEGRDQMAGKTQPDRSVILVGGE